MQNNKKGTEQCDFLFQISLYHTLTAHSYPDCEGQTEAVYIFFYNACHDAY